jgi:hypothetical protein
MTMTNQSIESLSNIGAIAKRYIWLLNQSVLELAEHNLEASIQAELLADEIVSTLVLILNLDTKNYQMSNWVSDKLREIHHSNEKNND